MHMSMAIRSNTLAPRGLDVTIAISGRTYSSAGNSVGEIITVTSDQTSTTFYGYTMENAHAGDNGDKGPIPAGSYDATESKGSE
jgi:hypothetical protein